jgi:replicative DNA helicase
MGGLEYNTILTLPAMSGGGKSTISKCIRDSLIELNPTQKFITLVFNLEMVSHQQIARSATAEKKILLRDLYSIDKPLSDYEFEELSKYYDELSKRKLFFIDTSGNAADVEETLTNFWHEHCEKENIALCYEFDHTLLIEGVQGEDEKARVDALMFALVRVKKYISSRGGKSVGIVLSQMNREIEKIERIMNKELHRPSPNCIFGASSVQQASDYIVFLHSPAKLNIKEYGTKCLPTVLKWKDEEYQIPYLEIVKQRSGGSDITIPLINKLKYFDLEEMPLDLFRSLLEQFNMSGTCEVDPKIQLM